MPGAKMIRRLCGRKSSRLSPGRRRVPSLREHKTSGYGMAEHSSRGLKIRLLSPAAIILIAFVGFTVAILRPREPAYHGRALSDWLKEFDRSDWTIAPDPGSPAVQAVRQIGTNALPTLLEMASTSD